MESLPERKNDTSRNLEKALQALEQAKQRVANEKKKQNEKKRKAEKSLPHKAVSPMPKMKARAIRNDESNGTENRGDIFTPFMGSAQIDHQRWYICALSRV